MQQPTLTSSFQRGLAAALLMAASVPGFAADYSAGLTLGSQGGGAVVSTRLPWKLMGHDQFQLRAQFAGLAGDLDDFDSVNVKGIDYDDGELSTYSAQIGLDWYPFKSWADEIFVSGGLIWQKTDIEGNADVGDALNVGGQHLAANSLESLSLDANQQGVNPYLSVGWGNRLEAEPGFDFMMELGLIFPMRDADVSMAAVDPNQVLNAGSLARERKEVEDKLEDVQGLAMITVAYHF